MNWVDFGMLALIALSAAAGFLRGFARELLGLAAWIVAGVLASRLYPGALPFVQRWIADPLIADLICFTVVFVVILVLLSIGANLLSRLVRLSLLGGVDRIFGAAFGLVRGGALLVLCYIVLHFALPAGDWPALIRTARGLPYLDAGAHLVLAHAPPRWRPLLPRIGAPAGQESF
ncbi:CvpA family protein [Lichenicoccus sp.]|uniref:CvpA family protein n=1 Tax=Lichenicoccus sp. TaxID=2781899 RepID=UPI003D0B297E